MEKYYWEIYHLMGDPSLMPYISVPPAQNVLYADPVPVGTISLQINLEQHSYAAISSNGVLLDAKYSGFSNSVTLDFSPFMIPGTVDIVITKQFRKPYIGTLTIVPGNTVNDAQTMSIVVPGTYTSVLNADVYPEIIIRNLGNAPLTSVQTGYKIDNGPIVSQPWSGNLSQYQSAPVVFPLITLPPGNHVFTAFVSFPNGQVDEYHPGDTISKVFYVTAGDAAVISHNSFQNVYCSPDTVTPKIAFANKGTVPLLSADINYQLNNDPPVTIHWTGNLGPNQQTYVVFPQITLIPGVHTFKAFTSLPNGGSDENPSNDMKEAEFEVYSNAQTIVLNILTDDYGSETTWNIVNDATSQIIYSGGPYSDWDPQTYIEEMCLGDGCYTFSIFDSYGDGQQGSQNHGTYSIANSSIGQTYGTGGGNWGFLNTVNFCINTVSTDEPDVNHFAIYPNPAGQYVVFGGMDVPASINIYDMKGALVHQHVVSESMIILSLDNLTDGVYNVILTTENSVLHQKLIVQKR